MLCDTYILMIPHGKKGKTRIGAYISKSMCALENKSPEQIAKEMGKSLDEFQICGGEVKLGLQLISGNCCCYPSELEIGFSCDKCKIYFQEFPTDVHSLSEYLKFTLELITPENRCVLLDKLRKRFHK